MNQHELESELEKLAVERSTPFCYQDYIKCPSGICPKCGSDDLMKITDDDGPEFGLSWIVDNILKHELIPVDCEAEFETMVGDCYSDSIQVAWLKLDTVNILKELAPLDWQIATDEWASQEWEEGIFFSPDNGSTFYRSADVENLF